MEHLPDWEVDWDDITPQCSQSSLSCDTFLPSIDDAKVLEESAIQYTMEILVQVKSCVPARECPHPVRTPSVAPMSILFKDEKYKAETIDIIRQLMEDANLSGRSEVCAYN